MLVYISIILTGHQSEGRSLISTRAHVLCMRIDSHRCMGPIVLVPAAKGKGRGEVAGSSSVIPCEEGSDRVKARKFFSRSRNQTQVRGSNDPTYNY